MVNIVYASSYRRELKAIVRDIKSYHKKQSLDFSSWNKNFLLGIKEKLSVLQKYPLSGTEFINPARKILVSQGVFQCAILYEVLPVNHDGSPKNIESIYIKSIIRTISGEYNDHVSELNHCEFNDD